MARLRTKPDVVILYVVLSFRVKVLGSPFSSLVGPSTIGLALSSKLMQDACNQKSLTGRQAFLDESDEMLTAWFMLGLFTFQ